MMDRHNRPSNKCYHIRSLTTALIITGMLTGVLSCSSNSSNALSESMAISISLPEFWLAPQSTFYWYSGVAYLYADAREKPEDVRPFLQHEIEAYLVNREHRFTQQPSSSSYGLVAVVVLGKGMTAADVLKHFDLTPSFKGERRYELGTILIAILDRTTDKVLWRGALQANIDLNLEPEKRRQRVREGISTLLSKVPRKPMDT